jgi:hypothetical protein
MEALESQSYSRMEVIQSFSEELLLKVTSCNLSTQGRN